MRIARIVPKLGCVEAAYFFACDRARLGVTAAIDVPVDERKRPIL
jgi:hypothetical protein